LVSSLGVLVGVELFLGTSALALELTLTELLTVGEVETEEVALVDMDGVGMTVKLTAPTNTSLAPPGRTEEEIRQ